MFKSLSALLFLLCILSSNVLAGNNPFAKKDTLNIGKDVAWAIDKNTKQAIKSSDNEKGSYYHLLFDNKQLKLTISSDAKGDSPKQFSQLEVKDVKIDGKQAPLFKWCLRNQERHNRFLQQGLKVKKNICMIDGSAGTFSMRLNADTLQSLQGATRLSIILKPFRTQLILNYDISDFNDMTLALNAKPAMAVATPVAAKTTAAKPDRKCWAGPPPKYKSIKSVEYDCNDSMSKLDAEVWVTKLVNKEKEKEKKLAAEKEKQRAIAKQKEQKASAAKLKQEELLQAEAAAIAASQAKQVELGDEITTKMVKVCEKYWSKGEHRCYCEKYIDHAPSSIQANSTCK